MNVIPLIVYLIGVVTICCICEVRVNRIKELAIKNMGKIVNETLEFVERCDKRWEKIQEETDTKTNDPEDELKNVEAPDYD